VIVGTRDRTELLRRTLPSLAAAVAAAPGTELVIVEQGAGRAADLCRESGICARVLHDDGVGVSRARNIGARQARGSVVLFTDDDCDVPVTWVADHLRALRAPGAAASCGPVEGLSRFTITDESVVDRDPAERVAVHRLGSPPWRIGHSANLVVLRATFLDVGGFDERLGPGASRFMGEDADLIVRVLHAGGAVLSGTGAPVRHVEWRTAGQTRANLLAYERGAGAWIGKAVRADPRDGRRYLRARLSLLRTRVMTEPGVLADPVTVAGSLAAFGEGLWFGWRAGGWHR
jgi:GT2 family glycosyltransferase